MAFVSTCTGIEGCPCGACGWDAMAEQVAENWNPPPPPVLRRNEPPPFIYDPLPMQIEEPQIYSYNIPRTYSISERSIAISLPNVEGEIFILVVPEGVGSGDQLFFTLPAEPNGIIQKEMITRIAHCQ